MRQAEPQTGAGPELAKTRLARFDPRRSSNVPLSALAVAATAVVHFATRPDWYSLQNGLDPYFYTGYAQNLDDALALVGDRWYFTSRWSLYLPNRAFGHIFGTTVGFRLLHFLFAAMVAYGVLLIGSRRWSRRSAFAAAVVVVSSPMVLRAVLGDYGDSVAVAFGTLMAAAILGRPTSARWSAVAGIAGAFAVVANPFSAALIGAVFIGGWLGQTVPWKQRVTVASAFGATFIATIVFGLLLFRWRYGIPNVYKPTIEFIKNQKGENPRGNDWLRYRLWVFTPVVVLSYYAIARLVLRWSFDTVERAIMRVLVLQYALMLYRQFGQDSTVLELPFYWHFIAPSLSLALAALIAKAPPGAALTLAGALVLILSVSPSPTPEIFPSWFAALLVGGALMVAVVAARRPAPIVLPCLSVFMVFALQLGSPRPEPQPLESFLDPAYTTTYHPDYSPGQDAFKASSWFVKRMDRFGDDVERDMFFWVGEGHAHRLAAMYQAHAAGRWLNDGWGASAPGPLEIPDDTAEYFRAGQYPHVAVLGEPNQVDAVAKEFERMRPGVVVIFDELAPSKLATRAVVLEVK